MIEWQFREDHGLYNKKKREESMGLGRIVQMRGVRTAIIGSMGNVAPCVGWLDDWWRLGWRVGLEARNGESGCAHLQTTFALARRWKTAMYDILHRGTDADSCLSDS